MTLNDKYKKIDKQFVLSDSSVNEYGFRLLTSGYQLDAFQKNPIGYYMHRREDGVVLKWEELQITDDMLVGTPVINLSHERGLQTCDEVENGFLNAASVGHIVVLEYSTDPEMMLPGQTGPTITKWYNKECSLVDIPGNCNALTKLYDAQENELNLADFSKSKLKSEKLKEIFAGHDCLHALNLTEDADNATIAASVKKLWTEKLEIGKDGSNFAPYHFNGKMKEIIFCLSNNYNSLIIISIINMLYIDVFNLPFAQHIKTQN